MTRILLSTLLLTIWTVSLSNADIFKCQQPDGTIVFTDNSSAADCKLERVELPPLSIMSDTSLSRGSTPGDSGPGPAYSGEKSAKTYEEFKSEVSLLVEQFTYARRWAMRGLVASKLKARRELTDIRAQKLLLQGAITQSDLNNSEKQELLETLATITE